MVHQSPKRRALIWTSSVVGIAVSSLVVLFACQPFAFSRPRPPLAVRMDSSGPYVILASKAADRDYLQAIETAETLHPNATRLTFSPENVEALLESLRTIQPRYALIFIKPDELDVNFAWKWLALSTRIDDDPLVDVSTGFITGASSDAVASLMERTAKAVRGESALPGKLIDNFGPNPQAAPNHFQQLTGCFMIPVFQERTALASISHGADGFTDSRLDTLQGAGLIHLGGHGDPDGVIDGVQGLQAKHLNLSPCVVFNGACYTGVTGRWFQQWTAQGKVESKTVSAEKSFCLNLLGNKTIAYLAALHPDHGIPVYQEMEYLAYSGRSLGDVMRHTHNGVILGNGGKLPEVTPFENQMPSPRWTASEVMLKGTAARVLFGDPALMVSEAFTKPPFEITTSRRGSDQLQIRAELVNPQLKSEFTDTYHADLASNKQQFNDRALLIVDLPEGWQKIRAVKVNNVRAAGQDISYRLLGYALETEGDQRRLHVQVDLPATGYMQSLFRQTGATVVLTVDR